MNNGANSCFDVSKRKSLPSKIEKCQQLKRSLLGWSSNLHPNFQNGTSLDLNRWDRFLAIFINDRILIAVLENRRAFRMLIFPAPNRVLLNSVPAKCRCPRSITSFSGVNAHYTKAKRDFPIVQNQIKCLWLIVIPKIVCNSVRW